MLSLIGPGNVLHALFTDRDANPIWYYNAGAAKGDSVTMMKLLPNGHIVLLMSNFGAGTTWLREVDLVGNTIRELTTVALNQRLQAAGFNLASEGFHHDILPLDNGHSVLLIGLNRTFTNLPGYPGSIEVVGDGLVDVDQNWNRVQACVRAAFSI